MSKTSRLVSVTWAVALMSEKCALSTCIDTVFIIDLATKIDEYHIPEDVRTAAGDIVDYVVNGETDAEWLEAFLTLHPGYQVVR